MNKDNFDLIPNNINRTKIRSVSSGVNILQNGVKITRVQKAFQKKDQRFLAQGVAHQIISQKIRTDQGRKWLIKATNSQHTYDSSHDRSYKSYMINELPEQYALTSSFIKQDLASTIRTERESETRPDWKEIQHVTEQHEIIQQPIKINNMYKTPKDNKMKRSMQETQIKEERDGLFASINPRKLNTQTNISLQSSSDNGSLDLKNYTASEQIIFAQSICKLQEKMFESMTSLTQRVAILERVTKEEQNKNDMRYKETQISMKEINNRLEKMLNKYIQH